jgi:hypothetical protein
VCQETFENAQFYYLIVAFATEQPLSIKEGFYVGLIKFNCFCHAGLDPASRSPKNLIPWIPVLWPE